MGEDMADDLDALLDEAAATLGQDVVDDAVDAASDPTFKPPEDKTEEFAEITDALTEAARQNEATFDFLVLIQEIYEAFAAESLELDIQIAEANQKIADTHTLIESRTSQNTQMDQDIADMQAEYSELSCDDL